MNKVLKNYRMFNVKDFEDEFILVCFIEDEYCV